MFEHNKVILLEVFKNQLKEEHLPYDELLEVASELQVHHKNVEFEFNTWEEFEEYKKHQASETPSEEIQEEEIELNKAS